MKSHHRVAIVAAMVWLAMNQPTIAELEGFFPKEGGPITLSPIGGASIQTGGIQFVPIEGTVEEGESPTPFAFFLPNRANPENVSLGVLGTTVTISGNVTLDVIASADAIIEGTWGKGTEPVPFPIVRRGAESVLESSFPYDGGPVSIQPRFSNFPVMAKALNLKATSARFLSGGSADPFMSLTENTEQKWAANSPTTVMIDGPIVLDVEVVPFANAAITGHVHDGSNSIPFEVLRNEPESTSGLKGTIPFAGGPITLEAAQGPFVTRGIDLSVDENNDWNFTSGNDPSPFESIVTSSTKRWSVTSNADVVIDGRVTLDVQIPSDRDLKGIVSSANGSKSFPISHRNLFARVRGSIPVGGGPITISPVDAANSTGQIRGIDLRATQGTLIGGGTPTPFQSLDANSLNRWGASTASFVTIDGDVELDVIASADAVISAQLDDGYTTDILPFRRELAELTTSGLTGSYPSRGGPITLTSNGSPFISRGLEISSFVGALSSGGSPAPFETVSSNASKLWSVRSETDTIIDGTVTLDVSVSGNPYLRAASTDGTEWLSFKMLPQDSYAGGLRGTFPNDGGPITIVPTGDAITTVGIEIETILGTLEKGENPQPFSLFVDNGSSNSLAWSSFEPILIDGPVTLDAIASHDAVLRGTWGLDEALLTITQESTVNPESVDDGDNVLDIQPLNQASIDLALKTLDLPDDSPLVVLYPKGGGPLTLMGTNGPVETLGIEFVAEPGMLFKGDSAEPFEFFLDNTDAPGNVTLGSLGVPAVIDAPITLDVFASADAVISGQWGEGTLATFPAFAVPNVPEPSSHWLVLIGMLGLLNFRRRNPALVRV